MKDKAAEYLPPMRDVPFALSYGFIWYIALWIVDYPVHESLGVVILAYVALWVSRLVVSLSLALLAHQLHRAALRTADRLGVQIPDERTIYANVGDRFIVVAVAYSIAAVATTLGASFILLVGAISVTGFPSLGVGFSISGAILLCAGLGVVIAFYARSYSILSKLQDTPDGASSGTLGERVGYIRHSERLTQLLSV